MVIHSSDTPSTNPAMMSSRWPMYSTFITSSPSIRFLDTS
ncbi:unnamed protein product [Schistosoma curassoni]|uniref:Uncharacterized protein n=1 Tax=Schistosoma curassoni TaxID=6186 RepID=A0A183KI71_9TREM|nr:unnamed protein product [Schistosoma curassoni]